MARAQFGYLGYYNRRWGYSPFEGFRLGGDGMSGYEAYGADVIALRGYENYSLTPRVPTPYNSSGSLAGNVFDKFTVELRYPVILQPQSTIFLWASWKAETAGPTSVPSARSRSSGRPEWACASSCR